MNSQVKALGVGNLRRQRSEHPVAPQGEVESVMSSDFEGPQSMRSRGSKMLGFSRGCGAKNFKYIQVFGKFW